MHFLSCIYMYHRHRLSMIVGRLSVIAGLDYWTDLYTYKVDKTCNIEIAFEQLAVEVLNVCMDSCFPTTQYMW